MERLYYYFDKAVYDHIKRVKLLQDMAEAISTLGLLH